MILPQAFIGAHGIVRDRAFWVQRFFKASLGKRRNFCKEG